jgi:hypothetical protein
MNELIEGGINRVLYILYYIISYYIILYSLLPTLQGFYCNARIPGLNVFAPMT